MVLCLELLNLALGGTSWVRTPGQSAGLGQPPRAGGSAGAGLGRGSPGTHLVAPAGQARVPLGQDALHPQEEGPLDLVLWEGEGRGAVSCVGSEGCAAPSAATRGEGGLRMRGVGALYPARSESGRAGGPSARRSSRRGLPGGCTRKCCCRSALPVREDEEGGGRVRGRYRSPPARSSRFSSPSLPAISPGAPRRSPRCT